MADDGRQVQYISLQEGQRYTPVYRRTPAGIVLLTDRFPTLPEEVSKGGFYFFIPFFNPSKSSEIATG